MTQDMTIPPSVRLNAWIVPSKILGIQRDVVDRAAGAQIIINPTRTVDGPDPVTGQQGQPSAPGGQGRPARPTGPAPPISIVR